MAMRLVDKKRKKMQDGIVSLALFSICIYCLRTTKYGFAFLSFFLGMLKLFHFLDFSSSAANYNQVFGVGYLICCVIYYTAELFFGKYKRFYFF